MEIKTKINKWDVIKLKSFCKAKGTTNKIKRQPTGWEKIFVNDAIQEGIRLQNLQTAYGAQFPKYTSSSYKSILEKQTTQSKNGQKTYIDIYPKKTYIWLINTWKDAQHS